MDGSKLNVFILYLISVLLDTWYIEPIFKCLRGWRNSVRCLLAMAQLWKDNHPANHPHEGAGSKALSVLMNV
mgnify:CR=1 FL=1